MDLALDTEVDSSLADFQDQSTEDLRVDFGHGLELLALAVLGFADGSFQALQELGFEFLEMSRISNGFHADSGNCPVLFREEGFVQ